MKRFYSLAMLFVALLVPASMMAQDAVKYVKVKAEPTDWCGEYLIVYEYDEANNTALVFNGALTVLDAKDNYISVGMPYENIDGEETRIIASTADTDAATFTVTKSTETDGQYYIQSKSGFWIGFNSIDPDPVTGVIEPNLKYADDKQYDNAIALQDGKTNVIVTSKNGFELRFNPDSGTLGRFRYHASGKKKSIKFYKKTSVPTGINELVSTTSNAACYDLQGRKIGAQPQHGMYIQNGKKMFVK